MPYSVDEFGGAWGASRTQKARPAVPLMKPRSKHQGYRHARERLAARRWVKAMRVLRPHYDGRGSVMQTVLALGLYAARKGYFTPWRWAFRRHLDSKPFVVRQ